MANESVTVCYETEAAFLITYRQADDAGKRRLKKLLSAAVRGTLPPMEQINAMTRAEKVAFADALPEVLQ